MIDLGLLFLASAQAGIPAESLQCRAITSAGAVVSFTVRGLNKAVGVSPVGVSKGGWPARALESRSVKWEGTRLTASLPEEQLLLALDPARPGETWRTITFRQLRADGEGLIVASGQCDQVSGEPPIAGRTPAPLNLATSMGTTDQCHLLAHDGRSGRFDYFTGQGSARFQPLDRNIWSDGPKLVQRSSPPNPPAQNGIGRGFAMFQGADGAGPIGTEYATFDVAKGIATVAMRFSKLESTDPKGDDSGVGVCIFTYSSGND